MIVSEIFYEGVNRYFEQIRDGVDREPDAGKKLRTFIDRTIEILSENREFFRIYIEFLSKESDRPEVKKMMTTFYDRYMETVQEIMREGIGAGVFKDFDTEKYARALYFLTIGALFTRYTMKVEFDLTAQNHFQIDSILESVRTA